MIGGGKEWTGRTVGCRGKPEVAFAAGTGLTDSDDCLGRRERRLQVDPTFGSDGYTEADVLGLLYELRGPRSELRVVAIGGDDRANAENYIFVRQQIIDFL